ncbi:MAG: copper resistance protein CopC [Gemmatimonadota bacterium]|nr:copper resistance protein CopC [Gemmatimonadota bacterium]
MPRRLLPLVGAVLVLSAFSGAAYFHAQLVRAMPGVDGTMKAPPAALQLWFNQPVNPRLTSATLLTADSTPLSKVQFIATPDSLNVVGPVGVWLQPGEYRVQWRSMSDDGHVIRGEYRFRLAR